MSKIPDSDELMMQIRPMTQIAWRNNMDKKAIEEWLSNFNGDALGDDAYEKNLALWLLYNFTFFNTDEVKYLCRLLLRKYIHKSIDAETIDNQMIGELLNNTTFMPLGKSSESGSYIMYLFRQENNLPIHFFHDWGNLDVKKDIVFIDDMTLSGSQAIKRIAEKKYKNYIIDEADVKDVFFEQLRDKKCNNAKMFNSIINCDSSDKKQLIEIINGNRILKNRKLIEEIIDSESLIKGKGLLSELIIKYKTRYSDMQPSEIYYMNRLLFEQCFPKGIENAGPPIPDDRITLLTLIAGEKAKETLEKNKIKLVYCIELDEQSKAFSDSSIAFSSYNKEKEDCKAMCEFYGKRIKERYPLGYKNGQYLIGLYYTIPNNTLPIFWGADNWKPLFIRHEKNYGRNVYVPGRYI